MMKLVRWGGVGDCGATVSDIKVSSETRHITGVLRTDVIAVLGADEQLDWCGYAVSRKAPRSGVVWGA